MLGIDMAELNNEIAKENARFPFVSQLAFKVANLAGENRYLSHACQKIQMRGWAARYAERRAAKIESEF